MTSFSKNWVPCLAATFAITAMAGCKNSHLPENHPIKTTEISKPYLNKQNEDQNTAEKMAYSVAYGYFNWSVGGQNLTEDQKVEEIQSMINQSKVLFYEVFANNPGLGDFARKTMDDLTYLDEFLDALDTVKIDLNKYVTKEMAMENAQLYMDRIWRQDPFISEDIKSAVMQKAWEDIEYFQAEYLKRIALAGFGQDTMENARACVLRVCGKIRVYIKEEKQSRDQVFAPINSI